MARVCTLCGKKTIFANTVSHAHNVSSRTFQPNLQRVRVHLERGGTRRMRVCTRCIRTGAIRKTVR
jgi:large subunit ribosomal protein L28